MAQTYTYQVLASTGNEPDLTRTNELAQEGWRLAHFNGDVPDEGGTRQWVYIMEKQVAGPTHRKKHGKKKK